MKWGALFLALLSAGALYAFVQASFFSNEADDEASEAERPASGMALLASHQCRRAETKRVMIRGVEDDFSPEGEEPAAGDPADRGLPRRADYDDPAQDTQVRDRFELASSTASGILVIRLRPVGDTTSDSIRVGNLDNHLAAPIGSLRAYTGAFSNLLAQGGWKNAGELYWASFEDLPLHSGGTVLELIQSASDKQLIEVGVSDDLSVDFMGVAVCEPPKKGAGVSLTFMKAVADPQKDLAVFDCRSDVEGEAGCDPFRGDQPCERELPLLCYMDRQLPAPRYSSVESSDSRTRRWSGGEVAATPPVRGDAFKTIAEADRTCVAAFGAKWRVADWHLGGRGFGFSAKAGGRKFSGRYWIDIKDQPYATCWSRGDGK